jgi:flagellar basal body-associated protein FliL
MTSNGNTLWIVIAVIAAITLIAIVIISIVLCKKRSRDAPVVRR